MDYQELIDELHCFYQIQETSRKKLDDDETEADDALSVVIFCQKCSKFRRIRHKAKDVANSKGSNSSSSGNASNLNSNWNGGNGNSSPVNARKNSRGLQ